MYSGIIVPPSTLPVTGGGLLFLTVAGSVLLVAGAALLRASVQRRNRPDTADLR